MQITFDPLVPAEVEAVCQFINRKAELIRIPEGMPFVSSGNYVPTPPERVGLVSVIGGGGGGGSQPAATIAQADQPDTGADAPSGTPLAMLEWPDAKPGEMSGAVIYAPLPAAADLFGTAPVAPPAGEASAPIVPPPPVPTAPPVAPAPSASALPVLPADAVDKHGLPWDERIHSGTRVKNADGSWRQRRGVDPEKVKVVENELRALMAIPTRPGVTLGSVDPLDMTPTDAKGATAPAAPTPEGLAANVPAPANSSSTTAAAPVSAPIATAQAGPTEGNVPPPPVPAPPTSAPATAPIPSPPVPPAPTAAEPVAPLTFATMLRKVTDALAQGKIKEIDVHAALELVGLMPTQIGLLSARTDLIPAFDGYIVTAIQRNGHA